MAEEKKKLGRGIASLLAMNNDIDTSLLGSVHSADDETINQNDINGDDIENSIIEIPLNKIEANKRQPRKYFDEEKLQELAESIKNNGLLQPIILSPLEQNNHGYEYLIVAGERRFRACEILGYTTIKSIIVEMDEKEILKNAIIENVQRENLNPVEEANGYRNIIENFGYTHEQLASEIGKSRAHITNLLRILNLPNEVLSALKNKNITLGHAKVLLSCKEPEKFLELIITKQLSVRQLEKAISEVNKPTFGQNTINDIRTKIIEDKYENENNIADITFDMIKQMYNIQKDAPQDIENYGNNEDGLSKEEKAIIDNNLRAIEDHIKATSNIDINLKLNRDGSGKVEVFYQDADELLKIIQYLQSK